MQSMACGPEPLPPNPMPGDPQPTAINILANATVPCIIDNQAVHTGKTYDLLDPHSFKPLYKVSCARVDDALRAVDSAATALTKWRESDPSTRRAIFQKLAGLLKTKHSELTEAEIRETTSSRALAAFEVAMAAEIPEELAALATALRDEIVPARPGQQAHVIHEPFGVVLAIAPWNGPVTLGLRAVANPIMAGNTCVMKTSEYSPKLHAVLGELFAEAGLPPGVLNIIHVDPADAPAVTSAIIAHPAMAKLNFTGSTRVGAILAETCGKHLKPCTLELGGACPFLVLKDADVKAAVNCAVFSGLFHSGQICMCTNTVLVHEDVAEEFIATLAEHLPKLKADSESPVLRGLFSVASAKRIDALVEDALANGAKVVAGVREVNGNVMQPLVLGQVTEHMSIFKEEIFGPVFSVITFKEEEDAVRMANNVDYGLSSAIFSKDVHRAYKIAKKIQHGAVHINGATIDDSQTRPHGGYRKTGWGRFNGLWGLREFSQTKVITINDPQTFPL